MGGRLSPRVTVAMGTATLEAQPLAVIPLWAAGLAAWGVAEPQLGPSERPHPKAVPLRRECGGRALAVV